MNKRILVISVLAFSCIPLWGQQANPPDANAQNAALEQRIRDLEDRVISLEGKIRTMQSAQAAQPAQPQPAPESPAAPNQAPAAAQTAPPTTAPPMPSPNETQSGLANPNSGAVPVYGGSSAAAKALNPDVSVIGDFIGAAGGNTPPVLATLQPFPSLEMHESEIGMQAIIDPYARGDFFVSFGEQGVNLEEGYITFTALPAGFVAKVGKMRSAFGKVNTLHNHVLPWIDRPLVTTNLVGGEDGIDDAGLSVQRIIPMPGGLFMEATAQVFRGDSGDDVSPLFHTSRSSDVSTVGHLRTYKDLTESTNMDIGFSYARGHNELGTDFLTNLYGVDATLRWKPLLR